jgi:hypothetical protein
LTLAFTGAGSLSIDALLNYRYSGLFWGLAALLVGVLAGIVPLLERKQFVVGPYLHRD